VPTLLSFIINFACCRHLSCGDCRRGFDKNLLQRLLSSKYSTPGLGAAFWEGEVVLCTAGYLWAPVISIASDDSGGGNRPAAPSTSMRAHERLRAR